MSMTFETNNDGMWMTNIEAQLFLNYFCLESEDDGSGTISGKDLLVKLNQADPTAIALYHLNYNKLTDEQIAVYLKRLTEIASLAAKEDDSVYWS